MQLVFAEIVGWEFGLVLLIATLLFGSSKIPELARSLGKASSEFRKGVDGTDDNTAKAEQTGSSVANDNRDALASDLVKSEPAGAIEGAGTPRARRSQASRRAERRGARGSEGVARTPRHPRHAGGSHPRRHQRHPDRVTRRTGQRPDGH